MLLKATSQFPNCALNALHVRLLRSPLMGQSVHFISVTSSLYVPTVSLTLKHTPLNATKTNKKTNGTVASLHLCYIIIRPWLVPQQINKKWVINNKKPIYTPFSFNGKNSSFHIWYFSIRDGSLKKRALSFRLWAKGLIKLKFRRDFEAEVWLVFAADWLRLRSWILVKILKLGLVKHLSLSLVEKLMFSWDFEVNA